jgi:hypothetical protein
MIQAQIRLLKDAPAPLGRAEAERVIEAQQEAVDDAFHRFLEWLGNLPSAQTPLGGWTRPAGIAADPRFDVGSWLTRIMTGRVDA